jgi:hypothetical protein
MQAPNAICVRESSGFAFSNYFFLPLENNHNITNTTKNTNIKAHHMPALKIVPIASHPETNNKANTEKKYTIILFI